MSELSCDEVLLLQATLETRAAALRELVRENNLAPGVRDNYLAQISRLDRLRRKTQRSVVIPDAPTAAVDTYNNIQKRLRQLLMDGDRHLASENVSAFALTHKAWAELNGVLDEPGPDPWREHLRLLATTGRDTTCLKAG